MKNETDILYLGLIMGHGGDAVQMLELATGMAARGKRVKIVVPALETSIAFAERCREREILVERSPWIHSDPIAARQNMFALFRCFTTYRAPILHLHTGDVCLPRSVMLAMDILHLPPAYATVHSPYETLRPGDARARYWASAVSRRLHRVICPSVHSRDAQLTYGVAPDRVEVIHNSVDIKRFGCGDPTEVRRTLEASADTQLIVFSSRLDSQKRPQDALEAFRKIASEFPEARLVFVGSGAMEHALKETARKSEVASRVHFAGYQKNVPDWLAAAAAWILPTESENFSLAILEALAAGCPIVSTWCPGNDEVLVEGQNALTTGVGDVAAQANALRRVLSDSALRARLSAEAKATARQYSIERMVDQYARCYAGDSVPALT